MLEEMEEQLRLDEQETELMLANEAAKISTVMGTALGREFIWDLLVTMRVFSTTFNPEASIMAFNEGRRSAGLQIMAKAQQHCPHLYELMTQENHNRGMQ